MSRQKNLRISRQITKPADFFIRISKQITKPADF